jgi:hypothetical protein
MPIPNYLQDEDEEEQRLPFLRNTQNDDEDETAPEDPSVGGPPPAMAPSSISVTPQMQQILRQVPQTPGTPPVSQTREQADAKLAAAKADVPATPKPAWWQRLAAAGVGFGAGYTNAARRTRPIDPTAATQAILAPGYQQKVASHERDVQQAQAQAEGAQNAEQAWWKNRQLNNQEGVQQSQEQRNLATAAYENNRNQTAEEGRKFAANERLEQQLIKPWGEDAQLQKESDPVPPGMEVTKSITQPGMVYVHPPRFIPLPQDLAPYALGRKPGDVVPYGEFKKAQERAAKDTLQQNKPVKPPADNIERILLNPKEYSPEQVQQAKSMFGQMHRDPNAMPGSAPAPQVAPGPPGQRNEAALSSVDPGTQAVIKQLVDYKYQLPSGIALSKPYWQNVLQRAAQYDPSFDATQYNTRLGLRKDFTSGKSAQSINALNTVIGHLDTLQESGEKMNNFGGIATPLNGPVNAIESAFGDPRKNRFELSKQAVADELTRAWRQAGGTEADIAGWSQRFSSSNSPSQLHAAVQQAKTLLASKLASLKAQYETGMGRPMDFHILTPEAVASLKRSGVSPNDLEPGNAGSLTPNAPRQVATNPNPNGYVAGHIYGGLTYLGGDPNNQASWKK